MRISLMLNFILTKTILVLILVHFYGVYFVLKN